MPKAPLFATIAGGEDLKTQLDVHWNLYDSICNYLYSMVYDVVSIYVYAHVYIYIMMHAIFAFLTLPDLLFTSL